MAAGKVRAGKRHAGRPVRLTKKLGAALAAVTQRTGEAPGRQRPAPVQFPPRPPQRTRRKPQGLVGNAVSLG